MQEFQRELLSVDWTIWEKNQHLNIQWHRDLVNKISNVGAVAPTPNASIVTALMCYKKQLKKFSKSPTSFHREIFVADLFAARASFFLHSIVRIIFSIRLSDPDFCNHSCDPHSSYHLLHCRKVEIFSCRLLQCRHSILNS